MTILMVPTTPSDVTTPCFSSRGPHRRCSAAAIAAAVLSLLLSSAAWLSLVFSSSSSSADVIIPTNHNLSSPLLPKTPPPPDYDLAPLSLRHVSFGIAGSARFWPRRREFLRLWWRPGGSMRGHVWLDEPVSDTNSADADLPPLRISADTARFRYTNPTGHPSGLRISRIVSESFPVADADTRWFFLCDDDTIVSPENLVAVLGAHDWTEMVYLGAPSESHSANTYFSHSMGFGGGGIAISFPLARALAKMQDRCLERYPRLYGSDDRLHACISELGVPLTREHGLHQWDIRGNPLGILSAHPIAPFISIHHVETVEPLFSGLNTLESLKRFTKAMNTDPRSFLQRAICYDSHDKITISVSLGYVVQVFPNIVLPRELERSETTYTAWNRLSNKHEFDFDTRDAYRSVCNKPILFFLKDIRRKGNLTMGSYIRAKRRDELKRKVFCFPGSLPLSDVDEIRIFGKPLSEKWQRAPRRLCCKPNQTRNGILGINVGECEKGSLGSVLDSL